MLGEQPQLPQLLQVQMLDVLKEHQLMQQEHLEQLFHHLLLSLAHGLHQDIGAQMLDH